MPGGTSAAIVIVNWFATGLGVFSKSVGVVIFAAAVMPGWLKTSLSASSRSAPPTVTSRLVPGLAPAGKMLVSCVTGSCASANDGHAAADKTRIAGAQDQRASFPTWRFLVTTPMGRSAGVRSRHPPCAVRHGRRTECAYYVVGVSGRRAKLQSGCAIGEVQIARGWHLLARRADHISG